MAKRASFAETDSFIPSTYAAIYRFGTLTLDVRRKLLLSRLGTKKVPPTSYQILLVLLQAHGRIVSKDAILARVWPGQFASDNTLAQHLFTLRRLLDDGGAAPVIVHAPGLGYRVNVAVREKTGLTMSSACEGCNAELHETSDAFICSYECTFCPQCAAAANERCPNCSGALALRPKRD